ncbi:MAG: DUF6035 family protein [Reichenbachiella sp.]|uniref:DUF6035 family protein n=1 Tax=Reichenbachiella sp. TaxID=2184521 RepID=UPI0032633102
MARFERSIKIAFDKLSGEILKADEVFEKPKDAFAVRRQFHKNDVELYCCECEQKLNVSTSKYDRLHFKHQIGSDYCILKDGNLTPEQIEQFNNILYSKESPRHKELKQKIADRLYKTEGIITSSIAVDNKFIIKDGEKRRPDVYCKFHDKEIVFEIQLSDLSLRYILSRYEFYKKHEIYLVWILDNFDLHNQRQLERDIKYLSHYENFFKLDEGLEEFKLECDYKYPFLTDDNDLRTKWLKRSISLKELNFDKECYQVYYFNFALKKEKEEEYQKRVSDAIKKEKIEEEKKNRSRRADFKSQQIIQEIKTLKNRESQNFDLAFELISELDNYEIARFNEILDLEGRNKGEPALHQWISNATNDGLAFIRFLLNCTPIGFDVNETDQNGFTAFQKIILNNELHKTLPVKGLFQRNYQLTKEDEQIYRQWVNDNTECTNDWIIYTFCNRLKNRHLIDAVFRHYALLYIIESAKCREIIGFNYKKTEWIAFANNAIQHHQEHWEYIEIAFRHYGLWEVLIPLDKKGTFQKKVEKFYSLMPSQLFDFDSVFTDLYPELMD